MSLQNVASLAQENLLATFDYLLHLDRLRSSPIFRLSDHKLPFFHEHVFSELPGVDTNLIEGDQEVWLSIRRLQANGPPAPHEWLVPWINLPSDPGKVPTMAERIVIRSEELPPVEIRGRDEMQEGDTAPEVIELQIEDVPDIRGMFDRYLTEQWKPWSEAEKPRRRTIQKYDQFFSLLQDAETGGSAENGIEIAWGIGIALWDHARGVDSISYPLISRTVELRIDPVSMSITVTPTEREPAIHVDAFAALEIPQAGDVEKRAMAEFASAETTLSPFDPATFEGILRFAASQVDSHGVYWPGQRDDERDRSLPKPQDHLVVTDTWVIYARKRSTNFIAADIKRLQQAVEQSESLPPAPALVVTEPSDQTVTRVAPRYRGISTPGLGGINGNLTGEQGGEDAEDLFFPKAFNSEQVSIISRLDQADGVVVQGPPRNGKDAHHRQCDLPLPRARQESTG